MQWFLAGLLICLLPACCMASTGLTVTVLYDNYVFEEGLKGEWGFACLVEGLDKTILFDTGGKGDVLLDNVDKLGVDLTDVDIVVISHDHWDHYGGLGAVLARNSDVDVHLLEAFAPERLEIVRQHGARLVVVEGPTEICKGAWLTGPMGTEIKEQALVLHSADGPMVIAGCAHPGIVAMVEKAGQIVGKNVDTVCGGFHLHRDSQESVAEKIEALKSLGVERAGPSHCSGDQTIEQFGQAFGEGAITLGVGRRLAFPSPEASPGAK